MTDLHKCRDLGFWCSSCFRRIVLLLSMTLTLCITYKPFLFPISGSVISIYPAPLGQVTFLLTGGD